VSKIVRAKRLVTNLRNETNLGTIAGGSSHVISQGVRDGLGAKAGLSKWTRNDVNDKVRQAKVEGSGPWGQVISIGRDITLLILTYDLALESKDRLQRRGTAQSLLYVLI
jgi:hypothetical protein